MLAPEFQLLQRIKEEPSKNGKLKLLSNADETLQKFLLYANDRFRVYRIKQIEQPEQYNTVQPPVMDEFFLLCDHLAKHEIGTNDTKKLIRNFLGKCTAESAAYFTKALLKDLDIGIDEKSINKVFPGLIPTFSVQLAHPIDDRWEKVKYPCLGELKADGMRVIAINDGESVKFYSREGREFTSLQWLAKQVMNLAPGQKFVLDGEIDSVSFNPNNKKAVEYYPNRLWKFYQTLSMVKTKGTPEAEMREHLAFRVWDVLDYEVFINQLKSPPLKERKIKLFALFDRIDRDIPNLLMMDSWVIKDQAEAMRHFKQAIADNEEGIMLKQLDRSYEFKRSDAVLKIKDLITEDFWIVGVQEGEDKFSGSVGALKVTNGTLTGEIGTGFTDADRMELWVEHLGGRLLGQWVEASYNEETGNGNLRNPRFERMRYDKERMVI